MQLIITFQARHQAEENAKKALSQSGQFGDQQYQSRGFEESQYGGGGGGGYGQGRGSGGFDGQGGFPGDQEMRGVRMEGQGYGDQGQGYGSQRYGGQGGR